MYNKLFAYRSVISFFIVMMLMILSVLRVAVVSTSDYAAAQLEQESYRIQISRLRGTIYDCNMVPLTNNSYEYIATVSPTPRGITAISKSVSDEALADILNSLKNNKPAICKVSAPISSEGICTAKIYKRDTNNSTACHILGYTDSTGHGVSGLEQAFDDYLYNDSKSSAIFTVNGKGDVLYGIEPYIENDLSVVNSGVVTTLDINIQNVAEQAANKLNSGCIVVAEAKSGKIRAAVSRPQYDLSNISDSFNKPNSPMLNRAVTAYSVGSVFKPCVAAAALELGMGDGVLECTGSTEIVDRVFRCHNLSGHGAVNLQSALAGSCNCFFYDLAIKIGGNAIHNMASTLSFGSRIYISDNMCTASGVVPNKKTLLNEGAIANLSIGQGELLLSPISMLTLYCAIANNGSYFLPSVVEKTVKDGKETLYDSGLPTRVMSEKTANTLVSYLQTVITEGTGGEAQPKSCTAAGKTATAQTGRYYEDGSEITNSWFCGFFPAEAPQYVTVVMSDSKLNVSTASIFSEVADGIMAIK